MAPLCFAVVGIGGYGTTHIDVINRLRDEGIARLDAVADHHPERVAGQLQALARKGIRTFESLDDLLRAGGIDVVTLATGIHDHVPQTVACVESGCDVVCEKPLTSVPQEADRMIAAQRDTGRRVAIGYQNIYSRSIQTLKSRLLEGALGELRRIHVKAAWPRGDVYYTRNEWAGKLRLGDRWVIDSLFNNAFSHYLNNALLLCGERQNETASATSVQAELYRARDIETADTASLRVVTSRGVEIVLGFSHATQVYQNPRMRLFCEKAIADWKFEQGETRINYRDGNEERFDNGDVDLSTLPFRNIIQNIRQEAELLCTPENSRSQTLCTNGAHESCPEVIPMPEAFIEEVVKRNPDGTEDRFQTVKGIVDLIDQSFEEGKLFSELGVAWAEATSPFDLHGYGYFPGGKRSWA